MQLKREKKKHFWDLYCIFILFFYVKSYTQTADSKFSVQ